MRHAIGLGVVLLLVAPRDTRAAGSQHPPCLTVSWVSTGSMSSPRSQHAATLLPSGRVLVAGGVVLQEDPFGPSVVLASADLYEPATGTWSATGAMSLPRAGHTMTLLPTAPASLPIRSRPPSLAFACCIGTENWALAPRF